jgi:N-acetylmuramoyl-L-alanine amidase
MNLFLYLIKTVLISGLLFGYYAIFLRNRFFHGFNRFFLLAVPVISFLLPAFRLDMPSFWGQTGTGSPVHLLGVGRGKLEEAVTVYAGHQAPSVFPPGLFLCIFSGFISLFLFFRLFKTIRHLQKLRTGKPFLQLPEARICFVTEKGTPFSFFKTIFWCDKVGIDSHPGRQMLRHELFHVKENHSLDILLLEILSIIQWFNPFMHLIRRELKAIHEYGADAYAISVSDIYEYASLLLLNVSGPSLSITHPFFKNQIKRRISMITKMKKQKNSLLGRMMTLPVIAILIALFSFKMQHPFRAPMFRSIRVIVDAGHGGNYTGVMYNNLVEKNINLLIARKIQELAKNYHVDVIMTRDKDENAGGEDLRSSLDYRAGLAEKENADVFISIHMNALDHQPGEETNQNRESGFSIYVPDTSSRVYDGSVKLGSILTAYIKPDYSIAADLKQRSEGIRVLRQATVPAVVIECGYLDNKSDAEYLNDDKNQEKIAKDILEGIQKYANQNTSFTKEINDTEGPANSGKSTLTGNLLAQG